MELRRQEREDRIMLADMTKLNHTQRQYIIKQQMEILRKAGIDDGPSSLD
jgi:hypothetical protein